MKNKWYFKTHALIIVFLCVGPFVLPLVWFNPRFTRRNKVIISIIVIVLSYLLGILFVNSLKSIHEHYDLLLQELQQVNSF